MSLYEQKEMKIRVTKSFTFDMAHALEGYDGLCKNIHGHTYTLYVTLRGDLIIDKNRSDHGMVIDFSHIKRLIREKVLDHFDHSLVLNQSSELKARIDGMLIYERVHFVNFQPSCENLLLDIKNRIEKSLPTTVELVKLRLDETPTSYAEWLVEDQL